MSRPTSTRAKTPPVCFEAIRNACAQVAERSTCVRIDDPALCALAKELRGATPEPYGLDPAHHFAGDESATIAFVIALDAINFGSGWFPVLKKRPGLSGYFTLATSLSEHFEAEGVPSADRLEKIRATDCLRIFGQGTGDPDIDELMEHFARAFRDLGRFLRSRYDGCFEALVAEAEGSAEKLACLLAQMPYFRDVTLHGDLVVPLFKRAQLTAADLHHAFNGEGPGAFHDIDELTLFADNLVPHVLRLEGVLVYAPDLLHRIDAGELLANGSPEEVEIRACAVDAVERLAREMRELGGHASPRLLDSILWNRGQHPAVKAHPRHRTRCVYY